MKYARPIVNQSHFVWMLWIQIDGLGQKLDCPLGFPHERETHTARLLYALGFFGSSESRVSSARQSALPVTMIQRIHCNGHVDAGVVRIEFLGLQGEVARFDELSSL